MSDRQSSFAFAETMLPKSESSSTFSDNLSLPVHRWFRYSAGFSARWAHEIISREKANGRRHVLDPFAGSGTVPLEGELSGVKALGVEAHPFIARVAKAKLLWREDPRAFREYGLSILDQAKRTQSSPGSYAPLIRKCFPPAILIRLDSLRQAWEAAANSSPLSELAWLALASILRKCSPAGTAQWQYILPKKTKINVLDPYQAFEAKVCLMTSDMEQQQQHGTTTTAEIFQEDARVCTSVPRHWADLVITSPPYTNNYDYADSTRLEMTFFGEIACWGDLQKAVRGFLMRSCTQHVAALNGETSVILDDPLLEPIRKEIVVICKHLESERDKHGGKKPYYAMIAAYFQDMAQIWIALRRVCAKGCLVCFVVGDSAPYGVHVPVERWIGVLALAAGFKSFSFEKIRDRNVKWKNRKHRVPLHEGRLWVEG